MGSGQNATRTSPASAIPVCRCAEFMVAANALGYDVSVAGDPLDLGRGFRYTANDVCGAALGLREDPILDDPISFGLTPSAHAALGG